MFEAYTTGVGIDISEHHIRLAQVSFRGTILRLEEYDIPDGLIDDEMVVDPGKVQELFVKKFLKTEFTNTPLRATLLLPESRIFSSSFLLPSNLKGEEMHHLARTTAQKNIPIPFKKAYTAISQGAPEGDERRTTVYAVETQVEDGFQQLVTATPFKLIAVEANSKAILRLVTHYASKELLPEDPTTLVAVADIGHSWATISVYTLKGSNVFSRSIAYRYIAGGKGGGKKLSKKVVDSIVQTIEEVMVYFSGRDQEIHSLFLSGVEALDKQLAGLFKKETGHKTHILEIGQTLKVGGLDVHKTHVFGAAIGAALRSARARKYAYQHNFLQNV